MALNLLEGQTSTPTSPLRLPRDNYTVRCIEEPKFEISKSSGQPMLVFDFEICEPAVKNIDGVERNIGGTKLGRVYATLTPGKTFKLVEIHRAMGLPLEGLEQNPEGGFIGITYTGRECWALCKSTKNEQKKEGSEEPLCNPVTGEPLISFKHEAERFFAAA